jgi:hypothetical protein
MEDHFENRFRARRGELFGRPSYPVQILVEIPGRRRGAAEWQRDSALPSRRRLFRACSSSQRDRCWAVVVAAC